MFRQESVIAKEKEQNIHKDEENREHKVKKKNNEKTVRGKMKKRMNESNHVINVKSVKNNQENTNECEIRMSENKEYKTGKRLKKKKRKK